AFLVHEEIAKKWEGKEPEPLPVIRVMSDRDLAIYEEIKKENAEAYNKCMELVKNHKLNMNLICAKFTFDRRKITFYYTAQARVDFRELLKDLTQVFKRVRIDLRHIGVRDETSIMEGCGLCGRQFCCCSWLKNFESINIKLAKDQGMPINPTKISGVCGRLLCCLNYEYENYIDAAKGMPPVGCGVMTPDGIGRVSALHFLNGIVAVKLQDGKIKDFGKKDIEMIDEDVNNIEIEAPLIYQEEEDTTIDISTLEDNDTNLTSNI
ncbi:MAG: regulatory iron-sulfur-containing complex subunit RicT, partial [Candidatus Gastranaerophilaceae bacterium]